MSCGYGRVGSALFLRNLFYQMHDFPHKRALAFCLTRTRLVLAQAEAGALLLADAPVSVDGPVVQVLEILDMERQRGAAVVVEKKNPGFQLTEIHLITDQQDVVVGKKISPCYPAVSAGWAGFKIGRHN